MSRPDRGPEVAVDFSVPRQSKRAVPLVAVALVVVAVLAIGAAVTQLLLR